MTLILCLAIFSSSSNKRCSSFDTTCSVFACSPDMSFASQTMLLPFAVTSAVPKMDFFDTFLQPSHVRVTPVTPWSSLIILCLTVSATRSRTVEARYFLDGYALCRVLNRDNVSKIFTVTPYQYPYHNMKVQMVYRSNNFRILDPAER